MRNWNELFLNHLNALFRIALLITGNIESAECALIEAISASSECEPLTGVLLYDSITFAVAQSSLRVLRQGQPVSNPVPESALALVHEELHPVFDLPPDLRCCFVLRTLAGYTREQVGLLMNFQGDAVGILAQTALVQFAALAGKRRRHVPHRVPSSSRRLQTDRS